MGNVEMPHLEESKKVAVGQIVLDRNMNEKVSLSYRSLSVLRPLVDHI